MEANITSLVQYLQGIALKLRDVGVVGKGHCSGVCDTSYRVLYANLMRSLVNRFSKRKLVMGCSYMLDLDVGTISDNIKGITYLELSGNGIYSVAEVIPRCCSISKSTEAGDKQWIFVWR